MKASLSLLYTVALCLFGLTKSHEHGGADHSSESSESNKNNNNGETFIQTFNFQSTRDVVDHAFIFITSSAQCQVTINVDLPPLTPSTVSISNAQPTLHVVPGDAYRGIKLESDCDDFVVYGLSKRIAGLSADTWLALPTKKIGKEYLVLNTASLPDPNYPSELSVVAENDNTECTYTWTNGTQSSVTLNALQVDWSTSTGDLTGTKISCSDKVAVFTGQRCMMAPSMSPQPQCITCDHVIEQLLPIRSFGREFALVPIDQACQDGQPHCCEDPKFCSKCSDIFRVIASEDNTVVTWTGPSSDSTGTANLQAGEASYIVIPRNEVASVTSNKPIMTGHFFTSLLYNGASNTQGDPSLALVPRVEKYKKRYRGATCLPGFDTNHATLVVKQGTSAQLKLNGAVFLNPANAQPIPGTNFESFKYQFDCTGANGAPVGFVIEHEGHEKFGLFLYGLGFKVSYGLAAGGL